jgi:hypothetical protein
LVNYRNSVGHSEKFEKMTADPLLLALSDKIEPKNVFGRKYSAEFPPSRKIKVLNETELDTTLHI